MYWSVQYKLTICTAFPKKNISGLLDNVKESSSMALSVHSTNGLVFIPAFGGNLFVFLIIMVPTFRSSNSHQRRKHLCRVSGTSTRHYQATNVWLIHIFRKLAFDVMKKWWNEWDAKIKKHTILTIRNCVGKRRTLTLRHFCGANLFLHDISF